jgi:disulfide bond formation protein DsbB
MPIIGKDAEFVIKPAEILKVSEVCKSEGNCTNADIYALSFNYTMTLGIFFIVVSMIIAMLMRAIKDAGND